MREAAVFHRELSLILCDDLVGWDRGLGVTEPPEGGRGYLYRYS